MTVIRITGNSQFINSVANVISLANTYGANATSGATCLYLYNSNTSGQVLTLANSEGSFNFTISSEHCAPFLPKTIPTLSPVLRAESNGFICATPIARVPS